MGLLDWIMQKLRGGTSTVDVDRGSEPGASWGDLDDAEPKGPEVRPTKRERKEARAKAKVKLKERPPEERPPEERPPEQRTEAVAEEAAAPPRKKRKQRKGLGASEVVPPAPKRGAPLAAEPLATAKNAPEPPPTPVEPPAAEPTLPEAKAAPASPRPKPPPRPREPAPPPAPRRDEDILAWVVLPKIQAALAEADAVLAAPALPDPAAERQRLRKAGSQLDLAWERLLPLPEARADEFEAERAQREQALRQAIAALPDPRRAEEQAALQARLDMLAEAQALATHPELRVALDRAQALQQQWRAAGRPPRGAPEDLYPRFKAAIDAVFARRQSEREERLQKLESLVSQAEVLVRSPDAARAAEAIKRLQERWKATGGQRGPEGDALWARFRAAADAVFAARRAADEELYSRGVAARQALIAEALARAEDEPADPEEVVAELHKRWKRLGPVPRSVGDALWADFRGACDRLLRPPSADPSLLGKDEGALRFSPFAALAPTEEGTEAEANPPSAPDPTDLPQPGHVRR